MPNTSFIPDTEVDDWVDGVDRHYYENQVGPASPFDSTYEFRLAAAIAKDRARHQLIRAVEAENERILTERGALVEFGDVLAGGGSSIGDATAAAKNNVSRSVDGADGAPDDAIKL